MKPDNNESKNEYQQILKKIQAQSKDKKQERALNIMRGETTKNKSYQPLNIFANLKNYFFSKQTNFTRYCRVKENRHTALMTIFLLFSSFVAWKIQKKYDTLRKRAQRTQTYKERQVEKENQYIEKMLKKKQFESVPIPSQLQEQNSYKFQQNQGKGGLVIDTKQDLMDLIEKDKKDKRSAEQIYSAEVKRSKQKM